MDNINNARGLLAYDSNVVRAPKNYLAPSLLIALAGAAFAGSTQAGENDTLMMFLAIASISMAATGLYMMFSPSQVLVYAPTGEELRKYELFFDIESDDRIAEIVRQLDSRTLAQHAAATSRGKKRVTIYTVPSAAFRVMQIATFVPYEYRPDADPVEI